MGSTTITKYADSSCTIVKEWELESGKHCDKAALGAGYSDLTAAKAACAANDRCSGVYDNRCDGQPIKYGSAVAGHRLCDLSNYESSQVGSCVYKKTQSTGTHVCEYASTACITLPSGSDWGSSKFTSAPSAEMACCNKVASASGSILAARGVCLSLFLACLLVWQLF